MNAVVINNKHNRVGGRVGSLGALFAPTESDLLDLYCQSAWRNKLKFWFDARASIIVNDGFVGGATPGWLNGLDGVRHTIGRHPAAAATAQRMKALAGDNGLLGWTQAYPVGSGTPLGTLLSSANCLCPPVTTDGANKLTVAILHQQPVDHNGWLLTTDDGGAGSNQLAIGFSATDDRYYAYSNFGAGHNGRSGPEENGPTSGTSTGDVCMLIVEFDGSITPKIWRNGRPVAISGTPTCGAVASNRIRIGSLRNGAAVFDNAMDGIVYGAWGFPDVGSDIRLALKNCAIASLPAIAYV